MNKLLITLVISLLAPYGVTSHGYLLHPTSRSSIWRLPEFQKYSPPTNYDDNALKCGDIHQVGDPGMDCGVCGDPKNQTVPRSNEIRGLYDRGIITGNYSEGQLFVAQVNITVAHKGAMTFRLCTNNATETQECFNKNLLRGKLNETQFPVKDIGMYNVSLKLPQNVTCHRCILQWNYRGGYNWGKCSAEDVKEAEGCGRQVTFRGCADIAIR